MIAERYEDGRRIITVDTAEEFGQVQHEIDNFRVEIEAPEEVIEALDIFDSAEEVGVEPDGEGRPPRPTNEAGGTEPKGYNPTSWSWLCSPDLPECHMSP